MTYSIRTLAPNEHETIDALLDAAFDTMEEVHLVHNLRDSGEMMQEHVLERDGEIIGYAALSAMIAPVGWLCLAPVAVASSHQGKGYGHKLVARVGEVANTLGPEVIVLGKPSFYAATGFSSDRASNLSSPYPLEFTLLAGPGESAPDETLVYPQAFSKLT